MLLLVWVVVVGTDDATVRLKKGLRYGCLAGLSKLHAVGVIHCYQRWEPLQQRCLTL